MTVPSYQFLAFALGAALIFNLVRLTWLRQAVLLTTNILFLASFAGQPALYLAFACFMLLFCWLKKYPFIPSGLLLHSPYFTIGLSYIFFRVMSLIIDAGQGVLTERVSLIEYLNFTLNFTSVTAGPIQRYQDYRAPPIRLSVFVLGLSAERIALGLFKVLLVSALLHVFLDQTVASAASVASFEVRVMHAALLLSIYPVYLYFNFSGYTDFVIGCALLFGLKLPENFQRPFSSTNFLEFWSRWHISLSNWLKTYVYNPLLIAMVRRVKSTAIKPFLAVIAYLVTFFLVGAWHGQTPEFLFFGLLQGGGLLLRAARQVVRGLADIVRAVADHRGVDCRRRPRRDRSRHDRFAARRLHRLHGQADRDRRNGDHQFALYAHRVHDRNSGCAARRGGGPASSSTRDRL